MRSNLALPLLATASLATAQSGSFTALTLNIAGLPTALNDNGVPGDKEDNAATIGTRLTQGEYDVVHLQEDFNYHKYLYENDNHPYKTPTTGGAGYGSGLNTLSNFPWTRFEQVKWEKCNGFLEDGSDCLTPKGYSFMRLRLAKDVEVDLYNLHADAGDSEDDATARRANHLQVVNAIATNTPGRAVLVFGDTNARYYTSSDNIRVYTTSAGLTDAWLQLIKNGSEPASGSAGDECAVYAASRDCEAIDKMFYRSGDNLRIEATAFDYVGGRFEQGNGDVLSDHNPVMVNFTWEVVDVAGERTLGRLPLDS